MSDELSGPAATLLRLGVVERKPRWIIEGSSDLGKRRRMASSELSDASPVDN